MCRYNLPYLILSDVYFKLPALTMYEMKACQINIGMHVLKYCHQWLQQ